MAGLAESMERSGVGALATAESQHGPPDKDCEHQQAKEATGAASSQEPKPGSEESEARVNRFKLFEKVMQKSLEKFIELAR